ncbi:DUF371 domain-containing protein [Candidatus Woesearchaeota archaeon]|nr:DUF371 domain-containing protein [Candidatus Woesearchaeota archaeon]
MAVFSIHGHSNILSTHRKTLEFTKDSSLTKKGDCIVGVKADFDPEEIKKLVQDYSVIKITILVGNLKEEITAQVNKEYEDEQEIVIRLSEFTSERTLGTRADKASSDIDRKMINLLKNPDTVGRVEIKGVE